MCVYSGRHISRLESIQSYLSAAIGLGEPTVEVVTRLGSVRQSGDLAQAYNIGFSVVSSNYAAVCVKCNVCAELRNQDGRLFELLYVVNVQNFIRLVLLCPAIEGVTILLGFRQLIDLALQLLAGICGVIIGELVAIRIKGDPGLHYGSQGDTVIVLVVGVLRQLEDDLVVDLFPVCCCCQPAMILSISLGRYRQGAINRVKVNLDSPGVCICIINASALVEGVRHCRTLHNKLNIVLFRLPLSVNSRILSQRNKVIGCQNIAIADKRPALEFVARTSSLNIKQTFVYLIKGLFGVINRGVNQLCTSRTYFIVEIEGVLVRVCSICRVYRDFCTVSQDSRPAVTILEYGIRVAQIQHPRNEGVTSQYRSWKTRQNLIISDDHLIGIYSTRNALLGRTRIEYKSVMMRSELCVQRTSFLVGVRSVLNNYVVDSNNCISSYLSSAVIEEPANEVVTRLGCSRHSAHCLVVSYSVAVLITARNIVVYSTSAAV